MTRLRAITTAAATCALALVVAVPNPASAETLGHFYYVYTDANGNEQQANRQAIPTGNCYNLPEMADSNESKPAYSPNNKTGGVAYVYEEIDCRSTRYALKAGVKGGANMKIRSTYFPAQG
ncbi:hypothetical protein [Streptomyces sp. NPDC050485]|uniref:hypothetical protein n=1 Tax=Streptomyces sp. NPDC050485 TaxID=3365617 RepID=UPI00378CBC79